MSSAACASGVRSNCSARAGGRVASGRPPRPLGFSRQGSRGGHRRRAVTRTRQPLWILIPNGCRTVVPSRRGHQAPRRDRWHRRRSRHSHPARDARRRDRWHRRDPGTATQPGMSMSRGISEDFRIVAPFRSFPSPVAGLAGAAVLGLFRELRTQRVRNRPRTSRRGQVEHKPVAMSPASARPPRLAHSPRATSCRNNQHRRHRARNLRPPGAAESTPAVITDLAKPTVRRRRILGGLINE